MHISLLEWLLAGLVVAVLASMVLMAQGCATYRPDRSWRCQDGTLDSITGCFKVHPRVVPEYDWDWGTDDQD